MAKMTSRAFVLAMVVFMTVDTMIPISAQEVAERTAPTSGSLSYLGGPAKARRARTETTAQTFSQTGVWTPLTNGTLRWTIDQNEETLSLSFSAKCTKLNGGQLRIRIKHTNPQGLVSFAEPYDGAQAFCTAARPATYTGKWIPRGSTPGQPGVLGFGTHILEVQFLNSGGGAGTIDDWLFELVVYD